MTYIFFLISVICLYLGLSRGKGGLLFAAGVALGCNVLARFSNLPEAAMIVGVWAYGIICWLEEQKSIAQESVLTLREMRKRKIRKARKKAAGRRLRKKLLQDTGMCLAGYLTALLVLFGYIQIRYGMDEYVRGIQRLFSMTEVATDYTAASMILGMFDWYLQNLYWELRMCVFLIVGMISGGILGIRRNSCKRLLCRERHDKKGAADPGMGRKCGTCCDHGILAVPAGVLR